MTTQEFKIKYPQHSQLEGNDLWDKMTKSLFETGETLYADPNQVKVYHESIEIYGNKVSIEDSSTTRWLNSKGELVRIGEPDEPTLKNPITSYRMEIINFGEK